MTTAVQSRPSPLAVASAVTPLAVSLAGNVMWGWSTGSWILIAAGVVTPLLLVLAIERWRVMPEASGARWWVRTLAMSGVVVVVAGWSWLHTTALLLGEIRGLHPLPPAPGMDTVLRWVEQVLCVLAPLAVDGLAVLSVLAMASDRKPTGSAGDGVHELCGDSAAPDPADPGGPDEPDEQIDTDGAGEAPDDDEQVDQQDDDLPADPAEYADRELAAGRTAGQKKINGKYPDLTPYQARQVSEKARARHAERHTFRPHVVSGQR